MTGDAAGQARLQEVLERPSGMVRLIDRLARLRPVSRRSALVGAAVAGSALVTDPRAYALRPQSAYATICGPENTAAGGWSIFCATINKGANLCPSGSFTAGWWKAAGSSWCGGGYRYLVDCNAKCTKCTSGCSDHICDSRCWNCSCTHGSTATCDQRRDCCNAFRYGQCNTQVKCSGGVRCRVVSCVAPYTWASCSTTSFRSDATAEHSSPYLPQWGPIEKLYATMGAQGSFLGASTGPIRSMPDGRGRYVAYQGGRIWWTSAHGAVAMTSAANAPLVATGVSRLGYPSGPRVDGLTDSGWLHPCEKGAVVDSASTSPQAVWGSRWTTWVGAGREKGVLGYPVAAVVVYPDGGWIQVFQRGAIALGASGPSAVVHGTVWQAWLAVGREDGPLGFPRADRVAVTGGYSQAFRRGGVWGRDGGPAFAVYGGVLDQWLAAGGPGGTYGFPTAHAVLVDGLLIGRFEGGTITHRVGPPRPNRSRSLVD